MAKHDRVPSLSDEQQNPNAKRVAVVLDEDTSESSNVNIQPTDTNIKPRRSQKTKSNRNRAQLLQARNTHPQELYVIYKTTIFAEEHKCSVLSIHTSLQQANDMLFHFVYQQKTIGRGVADAMQTLGCEEMAGREDKENKDLGFGLGMWSDGTADWRTVGFPGSQLHVKVERAYLNGVYSLGELMQETELFVIMIPSTAIPDQILKVFRSLKEAEAEISRLRKSLGYGDIVLKDCQQSNTPEKEEYDDDDSFVFEGKEIRKLGIVKKILWARDPQEMSLPKYKQFKEREVNDWKFEFIHQQIRMDNSDIARLLANVHSDLPKCMAAMFRRSDIWGWKDRCGGLYPFKTSEEEPTIAFHSIWQGYEETRCPKDTKVERCKECRCYKYECEDCWQCKGLLSGDCFHPYSESECSDEGEEEYEEDEEEYEEESDEDYQPETHFEPNFDPDTYPWSTDCQGCGCAQRGCRTCAVF